MAPGHWSNFTIRTPLLDASNTRARIIFWTQIQIGTTLARSCGWRQSVIAHRLCTENVRTFGTQTGIWTALAPWHGCGSTVAACLKYACDLRASVRCARTTATGQLSWPTDSRHTYYGWTNDVFILREYKLMSTQKFGFAWCPVQVGFAYLTQNNCRDRQQNYELQHFVCGNFLYDFANVNDVQKSRLFIYKQLVCHLYCQFDYLSRICRSRKSIFLENFMFVVTVALLNNFFKFSVHIARGIWSQISTSTR